MGCSAGSVPLLLHRFEWSLCNRVCRVVEVTCGHITRRKSVKNFVVRHSGCRPRGGCVRHIRSDSDTALDPQAGTTARHFGEG
jgi:hypothetical protein